MANIELIDNFAFMNFCFRITFVSLLYSSLWGQTPYPQDYFIKPLDIPIVLSGSFAELRSNHFHSGLDIKTQGKEGLKVYATADAYVSRIKVSHFGYGKAIYLTHPNGYTTVYAHLQKFSSKIEKFVKSLQYEKESFEIESFPKPSELLITKGEVIGFSGNTGGSGGPHLHYEIRDNQERPLNPMLFGISAKDSRNPTVTNLYAYPKNTETLINGKNERTEIRLIPKGNGNYETEEIEAIGDIGFGIVSYDKLDLAPNKNGLNKITTTFNGSEKLSVNFKRFSFDETSHINSYIDYEIYKTKGKRIQKLFIEQNNPLSLIESYSDKGYCKIEDSTSSIFSVEIKDYAGNTTHVKVPIKGINKPLTFADTNISKPLYLISQNATTVLEGQNSSVTFYPNTVYEDQFIDFNYRSDTLFIDTDRIPMQKNFVINYDLSSYRDNDLSKVFIARLYGYKKKPSYVATSRKGKSLVARAKVLGTYALAIDSIPPQIKPVNFQNKKWLSKYRYLKLKISDDLSGISQYRATINNKFILMEYDYKTGLLVYDFNDAISSDTDNNLKVIVTDNVGNSATFEAVFYRK